MNPEEAKKLLEAAKKKQALKRAEHNRSMVEQIMQEEGAWERGQDIPYGDEYLFASVEPKEYLTWKKLRIEKLEAKRSR